MQLFRNRHKIPKMPQLHDDNYESSMEKTPPARTAILDVTSDRRQSRSDFRQRLTG
jgi:hypothetical protein